MLEKHLRLVIDFKVTAGEITREFVESYYRDFRNYQEVMDNPLTWEIAARENRLLEALVRDKESLARYLTYRVYEEVGPCDDSTLKILLGVGSDEEILEPVIRSLGKDDAEFFKMVIEEGLFEANTMLFWCRVDVECLGAKVMEIRVLAEGVAGGESEEASGSKG